jgi:hypothetical protein
MRTLWQQVEEKLYVQVLLTLWLPGTQLKHWSHFELQLLFHNIPLIVVLSEISKPVLHSS